MNFPRFFSAVVAHQKCGKFKNVEYQKSNVIFALVFHGMSFLRSFLSFTAEKRRKSLLAFKVEKESSFKVDAASAPNEGKITKKVFFFFTTK